MGNFEDYRLEGHKFVVQLADENVKRYDVKFYVLFRLMSAEVNTSEKPEEIICYVQFEFYVNDLRFSRSFPVTGPLYLSTKFIDRLRLLAMSEALKELSGLA